MKKISESILAGPRKYSQVHPVVFLDKMAGKRWGIGCIYHTLTGERDQIKRDIESVADYWERYDFESREQFEQYFRSTLEYACDLAQQHKVVAELHDWEDTDNIDYLPSTGWTKIKDVNGTTSEVMLVCNEPLVGVLCISKTANPREIAFIKKLLSVFVPF